MSNLVLGDLRSIESGKLHSMLRGLKSEGSSRALASVVWMQVWSRLEKQNGCRKLQI